ncbi:hypothetical protein niasHT_036888 [Heterodera trifolii]|uniref:UDP-glucuronosyltransferase n=1 Tax=Heterodera trifolii TaxID=157864 RepID=A0ABD2IMM7_9BILA
MPFPTNGRISDRKKGTLLMDIEKVSEFAREEVESSRYSEKVFINGLPWKILAQIRMKTESTDNDEKCLGFFLLCDSPEKDSPWHFRVHSATFRIISQNNVGENSIGTLSDFVFNTNSTKMGSNYFISFPYKNVHPVKWMDQKSLLMHPKMRAFVSHCGLNSVSEAVQFGVPILAIPLLADQLYNAIMARVKGIAVQLDVGQLNRDGAEQLLVDGLDKVLNYPSYRQNVKLLKQKFVSTPFGAKEKLIKWVEFAAEFPDLNELNLPWEEELGTLAYYSVDIILLIELMNLSNGFYDKGKDKVTLVIDVTTTDEPKLDKFILDQSKSKGTLFMDIEKVSEFAREGLAWKIMAEIEKKNESTDNDEKWLGVYLLCIGTKEENWSCKCSAIIRIVSQKSGVADIRREFDDYIFDNKENNWGYNNFISFPQLMKSRNGFYNREEDKVTLAINFTVNEAKTRANDT